MKRLPRTPTYHYHQREITGVRCATRARPYRWAGSGQEVAQAGEDRLVFPSSDRSVLGSQPRLAKADRLKPVAFPHRSTTPSLP